MGNSGENKRFEAVKIPLRHNSREIGTNRFSKELSVGASDEGILSDGNIFYEIEYDSHSIPGVGRFVLKSQKIEKPEQDKTRDIFRQMREIARQYPLVNRFPGLVHNDSAEIFYKQAVFMKDFTDNYTEKAPFSQYYPYYQRMGYEQLRTYFTWRTEVRKGEVSDIPSSYAYLYIYELLGNIGVNSPQDGMDKLVFFWKSFRAYNNAIDKYVLRWMKDYHIYYDLPRPFGEFVKEHELSDFYPEIPETDDSFSLFWSVSKYNIKKSAFFTDERRPLIAACFNNVIDRIKKVFDNNGISFDDIIFQSFNKMSVWIPFRDALFYRHIKQADRRVVLSASEIYVCCQNKWRSNPLIASEEGKQIIAYIMKQTEAVLRKASNYKYKLRSNLSVVTNFVPDALKRAGVSLEDIISRAVMESYREATRTVVRVDPAALTQIRQEALETQEKLIIPETELVFVPLSLTGETPSQDMVPAAVEALSDSDSDGWTELKNALTVTEIEALTRTLEGEAEIRKYANECGIMPEVLIDSINEKAMDYISDNIINDEFAVYDDYKTQIKELVG